MFPFGTQYYRPPTPKPEKWNTDFELMEKVGFNIVRGWAMWGWVNPKEGVYDFSELERLFELCLKHNLKLILLINLESSPAWLYRKFPETLYMNRDGKSVIPHTVHNTCCGGFPGHCLDWPQIKAYAVDFIENLVKSFKGHPALYGWEPHNEPLHEPARYHQEVYCYCPKTVSKFKEWLKAKYKDIETLNDRWQRRFGEFEDVFPPIERGSYADWFDWRIFGIDNLVEHESWRAGAIRKNDPEHPVLMHTRAAHAGRNIACDCTDDWKLAQLVDKFGNANFPQGSILADHMFAGDICRCAAQGKEFWMHELQSGPYCIGLDIPDADVITDNQIASWTWGSIAQGAKGVLYWQFRTEQFGAEYGFNLVNLDGTPNERLNIIERIGKCLRKNEQLFKDLKPEAAEAAIAFSPVHPMMNYLADGTVAAYYDSYVGLNRLLSHSDIPVDIIRADSQTVDDDFSNYKVIYMPMPLWLDEKTAEKFKSFVREGGILVCEPSLGFLAPDFFSADVVPGLGLDKVFGCRREIIANYRDSRIPVKVEESTIYSRFLREVLIPHNAHVLGLYDNGEPAVVLNTYGKGKAVYLGTNLFMEYAHNPQPQVREFFEKFCHAQIRRYATSSAAEQTLVKVGHAGDRTLVCLFNMLNKTVDTKLTLREKVNSAEDIFNGGTIQFTVKTGKSFADINLKPYASRILILE